MTNRSLAAWLAAASVLSAATGALRYRSAAFSDEVTTATLVPARIASRQAPSDTEPVAEAANAIVDNDPFRLSNTPPSVRFNPASSAGGQVGRPLAVPPPRPVLVLKAIVGGPPWRAVIDGIPGEPPGTIAEPGTRFDKLVVREVTRDSVIVQGPDTSWVLSFRRRS